MSIYMLYILDEKTLTFKYDVLTNNTIYYCSNA